MQFAAAQVRFEGPLPPPEILRQYDELVPGAAQGFIEEFHNQTHHRQTLEQAVIRSDIHKSELGLWLGAACFMAVIALTGMDLGSFGFGSVAIAYTRKQERKQKAERQANL